MDKENVEPMSRQNNLRTPERTRLRKFKCFHSPNHLNKSPTAFLKQISYGNFCNAEEREFPPTHFPGDKCWTAKTRRVKPLMHDIVEECSFEGNQSFPGTTRKLFGSPDMEVDNKAKIVDNVRVDGPNGVRFNSSLASVVTLSEQSYSSGQGDRSFQHLNTNRAVFTIEPKSSKILIVNSVACSLLGYTSSELCGKTFFELFKNNSNKQFPWKDKDDGNTSTDDGSILLSGKVVELLSSSGASVLVSLWIRKLEHEGPCLVIADQVNAKQCVLTLDNETGIIQACDCEEAAFIFQLDNVERMFGQNITTFVPCFVLPQCDRGKIPKTVAKQKATGRTLDGATFPLSLWIKRHASGDDQKLLKVTIRVTLNVIGVLIVDENGAIAACNHHFTMLVFGKKHSEVIGHPIEQIIPNFCGPSAAVNKRSKKVRRIISTNTSDDDISDNSVSEQDSCGVFRGAVSSQRETSQGGAALLDQQTPTTPTQDMVSSFSTRGDTTVPPDITSAMSGISIEEDGCNKSLSKSRSENILRSDQSITPKLDEKASESVSKANEHVESSAQNKDTRYSLDCTKYRNSLKSYLPAQVNDCSSVSLDLCDDSNETSADFLTPINEAPPTAADDSIKMNGIESFSVDDNDEGASPRRNDDWSNTKPVTSTPARRPPDVTYRGRLKHKDGTELNVAYTVSHSVLANGKRVTYVWVEPETRKHTAQPSSAETTAESSLRAKSGAGSRPHSMSIASQCGEEQISGDYHKNYVTLKQIGKGAYGCVKMAYRRHDKLLVVAKFILKEKVCAQFWVDAPDKSGKKIPLEVCLLLTIKHPNIVNVLDVMENDKYFQMIMEKHGSGMDLFEFIERLPNLDEALTSYIFRQVGQAVEYLHSLSILHRDIKDENVIIDNKFHVKLIDFGSAAFMSKDLLFSTFYGTTEYCSPEVLTGNKYAGPELEMWSMGVTLYVLTFFENPFAEIEDTIHGELVMHVPVSQNLQELLKSMLHKDPLERCTVAELMAHPWITQPVNISNYNFADVLQCDRHEVSPEMYYNGEPTPRSISPNSTAEPKGQSNPSPKNEDKNHSKDELKRSSYAQYAVSNDAQSENYSLRSSADILDISSKPVSEGCTDVSSDATGNAACDIDPDIDQYDDSWDEQDSFS